jgi:6-pyruvoyltetrahydropterin/6-carboxytetrahydropterin synthase
LNAAVNSAPKVVRLTRRYRFAASHRLDTPKLSPDENRKLYGKCNNPYGHGHDYVLDVTIEGATDENGQLVDRRALDALVSDQVLGRLDHRNLNADLPEFKGVVATTENLAFLIRDALAKNWTLTARLASVRISETARNIFELETDK